MIILCFGDNISQGSLGLISFNRDSLNASLKKPGVTRKRRKILKLVTRSHDIKEETILPVQIKSCKVIKHISTVSHGFKRSNRRTSNMPIHTCFYWVHNITQIVITRNQLRQNNNYCRVDLLR